MLSSRERNSSHSSREVSDYSASPSSDDDDHMAHPGSLKVAAGMADVEVAIPENVYGAVTVLPMLIDTHGFCDWCSQKGILWLSLVVNWVVQIYFLYKIKDITNDELEEMQEPGKCERLDPMLRILCIMYFSLYVLMDVEETIDLIVLVIYLLPNSPKGPSELFKYEKIGGDVQLIGGGFSKARKITLMLTVMVPKLLVAFVMMFLGCKYLSGSGSNADLFLNSLALTFIIQVDEIMFFSMTPKMGRRVLAAMPAFTSETRPGIVRFMQDFGPLTKFLLTFILVPISNMIPKCGDTGMN